MYRKAMDTMLPVDEAGSEHLRAQAELKRRRTRARTVEYGSDWDSEEDEDEDDEDDDYGMLVDEDFDSTYDALVALTSDAGVDTSKPIPKAKLHSNTAYPPICIERLVNGN